MLLDDEGLSKRDHQQDSEQPAEDADGHNPYDIDIKAKQKQSWHDQSNTKGQRLPSRTGGLDDVVFQNGGFSKPGDLADRSKQCD